MKKNGLLNRIFIQPVKQKEKTLNYVVIFMNAK